MPGKDTTVAHNESVVVTSTVAGIREFRPGMDNWRNWQEILDSHFVEAAIEEDKVKTSALLKAVGLEAYGLMRELCYPNLPASQKYADLCAMLEQHYSPPVIIFQERRVFFEAKKRDEERVSEWYARIRRLAMDCAFGAHIEKFVLNKFVTGFEGKIFERLCEEDQHLTLKDALKKTLTMEAKLCVKKVVESEVNYMSKKFSRGYKNNQKPSSNTACKNNNQQQEQRGAYSESNRRPKKRCAHCGWKNHSSERCKFKNSVCHKCSKVGHLANVCNSKQISVVDVENRDVENVNSENVNNITYDSDFSVYSVTREHSSAPFKVSVEIGQLLMDFVVDSGAACSLMPRDVFYKHFEDSCLRPCHDRFCAYGGNMIEVMGEFKTTIKFRDQLKCLRLVVTNTSSPPILGRDFMVLFDIGLSNINAVLSVDERVLSIKKRFASVFDEGLGSYTGGSVKLNLIENVKPVFCKPRPVPFAWRSKIESQLKALVEKGVLVPVDNSDWGTPLVPIMKPNGEIRICGDYKSTINKYLEDVRYPLPLIDELFSSLRGDLFTKLDLSNAYNQLLLDEDSQLLCAWSTHMGIYKMTRLPFGVSRRRQFFKKQ